MIALKRLLLSSLGLALLFGCGVRLEEAKDITPEGTEFSTYLYEGYVELAEVEFSEGDYGDSDRFAERAITSGQGTAPEPESVEARKIPEVQLNELSQARQRLMASLAAGAAEKRPAEAAKAQVNFDCWIQEQEEGLQPRDIAACRHNFLAAVEYLESDLAATKQAEAAESPAPAPSQKVLESVVTKQTAALGTSDQVEPQPKAFVVYFDFDQDKLSQEAIATLMEVVLTASKEKPLAIRARGHTDSSGGQNYNQFLARKRVEKVTQFLIESGIDQTKIETMALGASQPAVRTPQGLPEPKNRRVEIELGS